MSDLRVPEWANGAILYDEFDSCFIGFGTQFNRPVAIYDHEKCVEKLAVEFTGNCEKRSACDCDHWLQAEDYMSYNVTGTWAGEHTPVFLTRYEEEEPQGCKHCGNVAGGCTC